MLLKGYTDSADEYVFLHNVKKIAESSVRPGLWTATVEDVSEIIN